MSRAIILSWLPSDVLGNGVVQLHGGDVPLSRVGAMAALIVSLLRIALVVVFAIDFSLRLPCCSAIRSLMVWSCAGPVPPVVMLGEIAPPVATLYGLTMLPTSMTLDPVSEMVIETFAPLLDTLLRWSTMSAQRPAQPVREIWSGTEVCHCTCWTLCEKRLGGTAADLAMNCARVMGPTSVPTLLTMASLPVLNSP